MAGLADIVNVQISTSNANVKQPGFGVPMILGAHTRFSERIRFYNGPADMLGDGFTAADAEYVAALVMCAQNPSVSRFAVGRRANLPTAKYRVGIVVAISNKAYTVKVNGKVATFTSGTGATLSQISAGLATAITNVAGGPGCVVADVTGVGVDLTASAPGAFLRVEVADPDLLSADPTHTDAGGSSGIADDLGRIALENGDWYGVCLTSCGTAEILAAAQWIEANGRIFVQLTNQTKVITSAVDDVATSCKTSNYFRTALIYHSDNSSFADAGWLGECLPKQAGSETWKFATLAGVATVPLTATQITNLRAKNCNFYADYSGLAIVADGKTAAGEWIDVIRGRDWLASRMQIRCVIAVKKARDATGKLAYTDAGIGVLEGEVRATLIEAVDRGFLTDDPAPVVTAKKASQVAKVDKAARAFTGLNWSANLQGAIHAATIYGSVSV